MIYQKNTEFLTPILFRSMVRYFSGVCDAIIGTPLATTRHLYYVTPLLRNTYMTQYRYIARRALLTHPGADEQQRETESEGHDPESVAQPLRSERLAIDGRIQRHGQSYA